MLFPVPEVLEGELHPDFTDGVPLNQNFLVWGGKSSPQESLIVGRFPPVLWMDGTPVYYAFGLKDLNIKRFHLSVVSDETGDTTEGNLVVEILTLYESSGEVLDSTLIEVPTEFGIFSQVGDILLLRGDYFDTPEDVTVIDQTILAENYILKVSPGTSLDGSIILNIKGKGSLGVEPAFNLDGTQSPLLFLKSKYLFNIKDFPWDQSGFSWFELDGSTTIGEVVLRKLRASLETVPDRTIYIEEFMEFSPGDLILLKDTTGNGILVRVRDYGAADKIIDGFQYRGYVEVDPEVDVEVDGVYGCSGFDWLIFIKIPSTNQSYYSPLAEIHFKIET